MSQSDIERVKACTGGLASMVVIEENNRTYCYAVGSEEAKFIFDRVYRADQYEEAKAYCRYRGGRVACDIPWSVIKIPFNSDWTSGSTMYRVANVFGSPGVQTTECVDGQWINYRYTRNEWNNTFEPDGKWIHTDAPPKIKGGRPALVTVRRDERPKDVVSGLPLPAVASDFEFTARRLKNEEHGSRSVKIDNAPKADEPVTADAPEQTANEAWVALDKMLMQDLRRSTQENAALAARQRDEPMQQADLESRKIGGIPLVETKTIPLTRPLLNFAKLLENPNNVRKLPPVAIVESLHELRRLALDWCDVDIYEEQP